MSDPRAELQQTNCLLKIASENILGHSRQAEVLSSQGRTVTETCRDIGIKESNYNYNYYAYVYVYVYVNVCNNVYDYY